MMTTVSTLLTLLFVMFFYTNSKNNKKELVGIVSFFSIAIIWSVAIIFAKYELNLLASLLMLVSYLLLGYYFVNQRPRVAIEIVAKQDSYWDVSPSIIEWNFQDREDEKKDRIEIEHDDVKFFVTDAKEKKHFSMAYLDAYKQFENTYVLTKIKSLKEIKEYVIFNNVYNKILESLLDQEIEIDLEEVLARFDYTVEFFLMHLWENYMKQNNIGIGQLEALVSNKYEEEFINALDNVLLSSVKFSGSYLFYKYSDFLRGQAYE